MKPAAHYFWTTPLLIIVVVSLLLGDDINGSIFVVGDEDTINPRGDDLCPCLSLEEGNAAKYVGNEEIASVLGERINMTEYGVGVCAPHDAQTIQCMDATNCTGIVPLPPDCDKSWCSRSFCYVDPDNCRLTHNPSPLFFGDRYYSYATCGDLDSFDAYPERLKTLRGQTLRVGFNSNSGGWKGAYNPNGSFADDDLWRGPIYDFVKEAERAGGFKINNTEPPEFLRSKAIELFGQDSSFDLCVYATSLGFLDFCFAAFTITERRSGLTTFYQVTSDPLYLVVFNNDEGKMTWEEFAQATSTIFQPFTLEAWLMIWFFALPLLGLLMLLHEYGTPGGAYPKEEPVLVANKVTGETEESTQKIPLVVHGTAALYRGALAFFQGSYDLGVLTTGGMINLLAIAAFIMLILSIYTANLAAILTQDLNSPTVDSIDAALREGYNFCAERKVAEIAIDLYGLEGDKFVPDPEDGKPGFLCCNSRQRVFDNMLQLGNTNRSLYCDAAIASLEDLQALHVAKRHCNKSRVGDVIHQQAIGLPVSRLKDDEIVSLFHRVKVDGTMQKALRDAEPESQCAAAVAEGDGGGDGDESSLTITQLTGVWMMTFSLALAGLIAKFADPNYWKNRKKGTDAAAPAAGGVIKKLQPVDQWGNPMEVDDAADLVRDRQNDNNDTDPSDKVSEAGGSKCSFGNDRFSWW